LRAFFKKRFFLPSPKFLNDGRTAKKPLPAAV